MLVKLGYSNFKKIVVVLSYKYITLLTKRLVYNVFSPFYYIPPPVLARIFFYHKRQKVVLIKKIFIVFINKLLVFQLYFSLERCIYYNVSDKNLVKPFLLIPIFNQRSKFYWVKFPSIEYYLIIRPNKAKLLYSLSPSLFGQRFYIFITRPN